MELNWKVFEWIGDKIDTPLGSVVSSLAATVQSDIRTPFQAAVILYIVAIGMLILSGRYSEAGPTLVGRMLKIAIVTYVATSSGAYMTWVYNFFFVAAPDWVTGMVSGGGAGGGADVGAAAFDKVILQAFISGLTVLQGVEFELSWNAGLQIANAILVNFFIIVMFFAAGSFCLIGFLIWLMSRIMLALYIIFGPIMVCMALFPPTKAVFEKWIGNLINMILLQGAIIVLLTMLIGVQTEILAGIKPIDTHDANTWLSLFQVMAAILFYALGAYCGLQLTSWAASNAGGLAFQTSAVTQTAAAAVAKALGLDKKDGKDGKDKDKKEKSGGKIAEASGSLAGGGSISRQAGASIGD